MNISNNLMSHLDNSMRKNQRGQRKSTQLIQHYSHWCRQRVFTTLDLLFTGRLYQDAQSASVSISNHRRQAVKASSTLSQHHGESYQQPPNSPDKPEKTANRAQRQPNSLSSVEHLLWKEDLSFTLKPANTEIWIKLLNLLDNQQGVKQTQNNQM